MVAISDADVLFIDAIFEKSYQKIVFSQYEDCLLYIF